MEKKQIQSLIKLLDDPNEDIFNSVKNQLLKIGVDVIPELESTWEETLNETLQHRIEEIIQIIQFSWVCKNLSDWATSRANDLLEGAFWIAKYQYPDLEYATLEKQIELIKQDIWLELNENLTALEKVKVINHILFQIHHFGTNVGNIYSPQNSYINNTLETKKGNPISLAIIYASIAQRLQIPIFGVDLPNNIILAYVDEQIAKAAFGEEGTNAVLFYINPFNKGIVFGKRELDLYFKHQKIEPLPEFYNYCNNVTLIKKTIISLISIYEQLGYPDKVNDFKKLLRTIS